MKKSAKDIWRKEVPAAKNVAAFIKASPEEPQPKLKQLRKIVKDVLPDAEETISYKMPLYKLHGKGSLSPASKATLDFIR